MPVELDQAWKTLLPQMFRKLQNIRVVGGGIVNDANSITITIPPPPAAAGSGGDQFIWVKITGHTQDGTNKRWKYDWERWEKSSAGYGGWTSFTGGPSGHSTDWGYAYNGVEDRNASTGLLGNGVTLPAPTGFDVQPVPNGAIVLARVIRPNDGSLPELWFIYENAIDGSCS